MAEDTRKAGLGPWTQLADEGQRLQLLTDLGRYDEVDEAVKHLLHHMATLPESSEADEAVHPWNVREGLLSTGRSVALRLKRFENALALNLEVVRSKRTRRASELDLAHTRFNDYGPLLKLGRLGDARELLLACRSVAELGRDQTLLGKVFSGLAELESKSDAPERAAGFQRLALAYGYQRGDPESCSIGHHNLANYMEKAAGPSTEAFAHRLAGAILCAQIKSGRLPATLEALADDDLTSSPLDFEAIVRHVDRVSGVHLGALFERLPRTFADGDAALTAIWQMVRALKEGARGKREVQMRSLAAMPSEIQAAFELDGDAFSLALHEALISMPKGEAAKILLQLREAGLIG